jgi:hypothetical protein
LMVGLADSTHPTATADAVLLDPRRSRGLTTGRLG